MGVLLRDVDSGEMYEGGWKMDDVGRKGMSLVFAVMAFLLKDALTLAALLAVSLVTAYVVGYGYDRFLKTCRLK